MLRLLALRIGWTLARGYWKEVFTPRITTGSPGQARIGRAIDAAAAAVAAQRFRQADRGEISAGFHP